MQNRRKQPKKERKSIKKTRNIIVKFLKKKNWPGNVPQKKNIKQQKYSWKKGKILLRKNNYRSWKRVSIRGNFSLAEVKLSINVRVLFP